jgi:two-component system chemotaxis response regulator CheY
MRALVVDDSAVIRTILAKILRDANYEVAEAADGEEALARLRDDGLLDVMFVDWNMAGMTGLELVRAVRASDPQGKVRIMMVTYDASMASVQEVLAAGANEYLMKPFTKEMVAEKLALLTSN